LRDDTQRDGTMADADGLGLNNQGAHLTPAVGRWDAPANVPLVRASRTWYRTGWIGRLIRSRVAVPAVAFLALLLILALFGSFLAPWDPYESDLSARLAAPSADHLLGTDSLGRDLLSRIMAGAQIDLSLSIAAVSLAIVVGATIGLVAGFYGGLLDSVLMSICDVMLAFPYLLLMLIVVAALGPSIVSATVAISIALIPAYARLTRGVVLTVKEQEYVLAARSVGVPVPRLLVRHILINSASPIIVQSSLNLGSAILSVAALSFIGLGAQPPSPEWGRMLSDGRDVMRVAWWITTFPGLAILMTVIAFNLLGDSLRDALDPRVKT
jgi:peptide/nickel transport system permease protein